MTYLSLCDACCPDDAILMKSTWVAWMPQLLHFQKNNLQSVFEVLEFLLRCHRIILDVFFKTEVDEIFHFNLLIDSSDP